VVKAAAIAGSPIGMSLGTAKPAVARLQDALIETIRSEETGRAA